MLDLLSRFRSKSSEVVEVPDDDPKQQLPFPATQNQKSQERGTVAYPHDLTPLSTPRSSEIADSGAYYDEMSAFPAPALALPAPSHAAHARQDSSDSSIDELGTEMLKAFPAPPAVIRLPSESHLHPIGRSVSSPPTSGAYVEATAASLPLACVPTPNYSSEPGDPPSTSQGRQPLRIDLRPHTTGNASLFDYADQFPLAKQLSPIAEQDYVSPDSLRRAMPLPGDRDREASATNSSPGGSQSSEITRPSPSYSSPFITRQLNRTISQTSSRTINSTTSSQPRQSSKPSLPPSIPPLDLRPPFPGPHPNYPTNGPPLRPRKQPLTAMPTIPASSESANYLDAMDDEGGEYGDGASLHAESFVTASDVVVGTPLIHRPMEMDAAETARVDAMEKGSLGVPSVRSKHSKLPSVSESFISRRWDRDAALGSGVVVFRAKRQWSTSTPAFWAFWLGFICPFLWLVGGWHFTQFGEQPPKLTFWEFYFNISFWKDFLLCRRRKQKRNPDKGKAPSEPPLPRWVAEKQDSDDGRARLNDPKRSLKGISFGYPFVPRTAQQPRQQSWYHKTVRRVVSIVEKPNRLFDQLYGVKLREVRGRPESGRRMFDPWIQRCRYAFCYALVLLCVGLCTTSTYLIIYNTRSLR